MTPNIGVTCNVEEVRYGGLWTETAAMVPLTYVRAIARAGARPLLIAPTPADLADPSELLDLLDGVLVTGGADLDASTYGEPAHPETEATSADRDAFIQFQLDLDFIAAEGVEALRFRRGVLQRPLVPGMTVVVEDELAVEIVELGFWVVHL